MSVPVSRDAAAGIPPQSADAAAGMPLGSADPAAGTPSGSAEDASGLALVLALTDRVETAIAAGEWQAAAELEHERKAALVLLFERSGTQMGPELRAVLAGVAASTHRLIGQAHHHRGSVLRDAATIRVGRKAAEEYERNAL